MRRVVVTGMGIVSSIGNNAQEVTASLHAGKSGITRAERFAELGFRCRSREPRHRAPKSWSIAGRCAFTAAALHGTMSPWIRRSWTAVLALNEVSNERTGIIMGSGGPSTRAIVEAADIARDQGPRTGRAVRGAEIHVVDRVRRLFRPGSRSRASVIRSPRPARPRATASAAAYEHDPQWGKQDVMFAGGGEELDWTLVGAVRRDGRDVRPAYNATPSAGVARL